MATFYCCPKRSIQAIMIFSASFVAAMIGSNMSFNILAMVESSTPPWDAMHPSNCKMVEGNASILRAKLRGLATVYKWDYQIQGLIIGAYYWGVVVTSLPGGWISEKVGVKHTVGTSMVLSSVLTVLVPTAANYHYNLLICLRFVLGLLGGVIYPALQCLISKWAPPSEKHKFTSTLFGGSLGPAVTWQAAGPIATYFGWHWSFYASAVVAIIFCFHWYVIVTETPDDHKTITIEEKIYINESIGTRVSKVSRPPPLKKMFLSKSVWALVMLHFGNLWGLYFLMTIGPTYVTEVLGFDLNMSGILASLPLFVRAVFGFWLGLMGDWIMREGCMELITMRKIFLCLSTILPGLFLLIQTYLECNNTAITVLLITLSLGLNGASVLTNYANVQDLSPNFAGTLYGLVNCLGSICIFINPSIVGAVTKYYNTIAEWRILFWMGGWIYIGSGVTFLIFGKAEIQPWNSPDETIRKKRLPGPIPSPDNANVNPDPRLSEISGEVAVDVKAGDIKIK